MNEFNNEKGEIKLKQSLNQKEIGHAKSFSLTIGQST